MDLVTIQQWIQATDAKQPYPFRSGAECVTAAADFPFLMQIRGHDDQRLPEYATAL